MKPKDLLKSVLMKEIISIRIDTMWKMLGLLREKRLPGKNEEGATGIFDNRGGMFIPGGLVFNDSDRKPVEKEKHGRIGASEFRRKLYESLKYDNATLLYNDGMATGVNLDNGFFADIASTILANKKAALRRRLILESRPISRIYSDDITRSHAPSYVDPPYGARHKLSSCIAVCLAEPRMYYVACRQEFGLRGTEELRVWEDIRAAARPVTGKDGVVLAPPCVVVCHNTRHHQRNLVGLTRILGFGKFGAFATISLERLNKNLAIEVGQEGGIDAKDIFADYQGICVVGVLRIYPPTQPGKRQKRTTSLLIAPEEDMGLKLKALTRESMDRYKIPK